MKDALKDGQFNARAGVTSAYAPDDIPVNSLAWAKNVSVRGGKPRTRPAFIERGRLPKGRLQGIEFFSAHGGMFVCQVGGVLYRLTLQGNDVKTQQIGMEFFNSAKLPTVWMQETDGSFIVQDGQSAPIIYDGASGRRARRDKFEVPIGRQMAYGNGRLWVATSSGLMAGDIKTKPFQSELLFNESDALAGGGAFYLPRKTNGLAFMPVADTATGLGSLLAFTDGNTESLRAEVASRDLWSQLPGFKTEALPGIGACSHHAIVRVNQDVYFRSSDGAIRSFRSSRLEINSPGNTPISREVSRLLDFESVDMLAHASAVYFDDRVLFTASPLFGPRGQVVFRDIVSLDASPLSSNQGKLPPVYDGEWEGAQFVRLVKGTFAGVERAFAVSCDRDGISRLWEITKRGIEDRSSAGVSRIKSCVEYRRFAFSTPNQLKRLDLCRVYLSGISGAGTLEVHFRADNEEQWRLWDQRSFTAMISEAEGAGTDPHPLKNIHPQYRHALGTFSSPEDIDGVSQRSVCVGFMFQIRLVWTGCAQIDRVELFAAPVDEQLFSDREEPAAGTLMATAGNEISYVIPTAGGSVIEPSLSVYANHLGDNYGDNSGTLYTKQQ